MTTPEELDALRERLFPDNANWRPLDSLLGLLTQIDNMTTAIAPPVGARVTVKPGEIERAVWSAMIWAASNNAGFNGVPEYTDRGNSFAEDEARRAAARILAALLPAGEGE